MKSKIIVGVLSASLGIASVADACHGKHHEGKGIKGKITSVSKNTMSLAVSNGSGSQTLTVRYSKATTIAGVAGHALNSSLVGSSVTVVGATEGKTIRASEIVIAG